MYCYALWHHLKIPQMHFVTLADFCTYQCHLFFSYSFSPLMTTEDDDPEEEDDDDEEEIVIMDKTSLGEWSWVIHCDDVGYMS